MNTNVIKEYLVALGFQLNHPEWNQFQQALNQAGMEVRRATGNMSHDFTVAAGVIGGALASVVAGTAALLDNTAQADLGFQVYARRMFMSTDAAKQLKIATDALGYSLEDIIWGPKELGERYRRLIEIQKELTKSLGGPDFEKQMYRLRSMMAEFTYFKVELGYLAQNVARLLSHAFFGEDDAVLNKLQNFNKWFIDNLPRISQEISGNLGPAVKDIMAIGRDLWGVLKDVLSTFIAFTGQVAHMDNLKSGEVTIANLASATERWLKALRNIIDALKEIYDFLNEGSKSPYTPEKFGANAGATTRGIIQRMFPELFSKDGGVVPDNMRQYLHPMAQTRKSIQDEIRRAAREAGIPESLALSVAREESNFNQGAVSNKGAIGVMQLMPGTAAGLGVDPNDAGQNIRGGLTYLRQLFDKYHDWQRALEAYNWGPGNVDRMRGRVPPEVKGYADRIIHRTDIGGVTVNVQQPHATPEQISSAVREGVTKALGKQTKDNLVQFQEVYS